MAKKKFEKNQKIQSTEAGAEWTEGPYILGYAFLKPWNWKKKIYKKIWRRFFLEIQTFTEVCSNHFIWFESLGV